MRNENRLNHPSPSGVSDVMEVIVRIITSRFPVPALYLPLRAELYLP